MYTNTNPAELYNGTTWELITSDKYIRTGATALQTGGSNSVAIVKANLPNVKLKVETFNVTVDSHYHYQYTNASSGALPSNSGVKISSSQYPFATASTYEWHDSYTTKGTSTVASVGKTLIQEMELQVLHLQVQKY